MRMFAQFDADSSGAIDADELSLALASNYEEGSLGL